MTNSGNDVTIKSEDMFHSKADPMYEVTGSAFDSNPKEVQQIIETLEEWGVEIKYGESTLGYGCLYDGRPGYMSVTYDASYSAWLHEFQHAKDDKEGGWNGRYVLWQDVPERIRREQVAYAKEIELAKSMGRLDIVKRLEENLDEEIRLIKERDEYYRKIWEEDNK